MPHRIVVDRKLCVGSGVCCKLAPRTFELDDGTRAVCKNPEGDAADLILEAAKSCPVTAIFVFDAEARRRLWPVGFG